MLRDLIERRTPRLLKLLPDGGDGWQVHHALFARTGFTEPVRQAAIAHNVQLIDLARIDADLSNAS